MRLYGGMTMKGRPYAGVGGSVRLGGQRHPAPDPGPRGPRRKAKPWRELAWPARVCGLVGVGLWLYICGAALWAVLSSVG